MPTASKPLMVKLHNPQRLHDAVGTVQGVLEEMRNVNLNNNPLQWHTKLRWEEQLEGALAFLQKLMPPDDTGVIETDS